MKKNIKQILFFIGIYAFACAFVTSYQELWMASNNLSVKTISIVYSLCALITVSVIFLCSSLVRTKIMKKFIESLVFIRIFTIFSLFLLNNTGLNVLIKFIIMVDYVIDIEISTSFYPLIALTTMDDGLYAKKDLLYNGLYYIAVLLSLVLLKKNILFITFNYNSYLFLASLLMFISYLILKKYSPKIKEKKQNNLFDEVIDYIKKDKVLQDYFAYLVFNQLSYNVTAGIVITLLTSALAISETSAVIINTVAGVLAVILGIVVLAKLTFKNEKVDLFIKFGIRIVLYILAIVFKTKYLYLAAILYTIISSVAYSHITDAPYINRVAEPLQFALCNLRSMLIYGSKALGVFLCGMAIGLGLRFVFIFAALFGIIQLLFIYHAVDLRKAEI